MIRETFSDEDANPLELNALGLDNEYDEDHSDVDLPTKKSAQYNVKTFEEDAEYKTDAKFTDRHKKKRLSKADTLRKRHKKFDPHDIVEEYDMKIDGGNYRNPKYSLSYSNEKEYKEFLDKIRELQAQKHSSSSDYDGLTYEEITRVAEKTLFGNLGEELRRNIWVFRTAFYRDIKTPTSSEWPQLWEEYEIARALQHHRYDNDLKVTLPRSSELYREDVRGYKETRRLAELWEQRGSPDRPAGSVYQPDINKLLQYVRTFKKAPIWVVSAAMDAGVDLERPPSDERIFAMAKAWKFSPVMWENVAERVGNMGLWQRMVAGSIANEMAREHGIRIKYPSNRGYYGNTITCRFPEFNQEGIATWCTDKSLREEFWQRLKHALEKGKDQALAEHARDFKGNRRRVITLRFDRAGLSKKHVNDLVENASVASLSSVNVGHFRAALDYLHEKVKEADANANIDWCTTSALALVNTFGTQWKQRLEESTGLFSPQSIHNTLRTRDRESNEAHEFEVVTTFSKPQKRKWSLAIGDAQYTITVNHAGKIVGIPDKVQEMLGNKWRKKLNSVVLTDNAESKTLSTKDGDVTLDFTPPEQEVWDIKVYAPNNAALANGSGSGFIAKGKATINRHGEIISMSDECKHATLRWQVDGKQLETEFRSRPSRIENRSYHDATYWLPTQASNADLNGFDAFLVKFKDRDIKELSTIAGAWHRLDNAERILSYKEILGAIRSKSYDGIEFPDFGEEAAYWGVGEGQYKNLENLYKQSLSVPEPFDSSKRWEKNGLVGRFLPRSDPRVGFFGKHTNCCQHLLKDHGTACAVSTMSDPFSQLFVVEKEGKIIAGSWVWQTPTSFADPTDEKKHRNYNTVCFDNIEALTLSDNQQAAILDIYQQTSEHLAQSGARKVTVGTGLSDVDLGSLDDVESLMLPNEYSGYTDAASQKLLSENLSAPPLGKEKAEEVWVRGALEQDLEKAQKVAKAVYPPEWARVDMPGDDPRGIVLMHKTEGVIGYAVWSEQDRYISDMAVMPTKDDGKGGKTQDPKHSLKLIRAVMDMCQEKGGTWRAEARESSTYRLLKSMEKNGRISLEDNGISHYIGDEPVYDVEFTANKRNQSVSTSNEHPASPPNATATNTFEHPGRRLESFLLDDQYVNRAGNQILETSEYDEWQKQQREDIKRKRENSAKEKERPNRLVYESHPDGKVNDVLAQKLQEKLGWQAGG